MTVWYVTVYLCKALCLFCGALWEEGEGKPTVLSLWKSVFTFIFSSVDSFMDTVKNKNVMLMVLCIQLFKVHIMVFFVVLAV